MFRKLIFVLLLSLSIGSLHAATPILNLSFEDDLLDSSGNGNHGIFGGTGTTFVSGGQNGKAVNFNGNGHIVLPNNILKNNPDFTISVHFKVANGIRGGIVGYQNNTVAGFAAASNYIPIIAIDNTGKLRAELWTTGSGVTVTSAANVDDNNWHHVVVTSDTTGNKLTVYLDGAQIGTQTAAILHLDMSFNQIGITKSLGRTALNNLLSDHFIGEVDEFILYNQALAAAEISKTVQFITFSSIPTQTVSSFSLSATASSGLTVSYSSNTNAVCTVSGSTVTYVSAGTCSIKASQAGNTTFSAAPDVTRSFSMNATEVAAAQSIPTLSFSGLFILITLLGIFGVKSRIKK